MIDQAILERIANARKPPDEFQPPEQQEQPQQAPQEAAYEAQEHQDHQEYQEQEGTREQPQGAQEQPQEAQELPEEVGISTLDDIAEHLGVDVAELYNVKMRINKGDHTDEVTLGQYKDQIHGMAEYSKRQAEVDRKLAEADKEKAKQAESIKTWEQRITSADNTLTLASKQLQRDANHVDWETLRRDDPAEFAAKRQEFTDRQQELGTAYQQIQDEVENYRREQQQSYAELAKKEISQEKEKLLNWKKDWSEENDKELTGYLKSEKWTDEEIAGVVSHKHVIAAHKAMLWDNAQKEAGAARQPKAKAKTPVIKPGVRSASKTAKQADLDAKRQRLKKTGRLRDAVTLRRATRS